MTSTSENQPTIWSFRDGLLVALLALLVGLSSFTSIDQYAEEDYEVLFQRALVTFALARTLNGLISAVQGTEVALQPAGVGVTLTPGEILDPVNDLVERFSWIMLGATISLGVQQVLLDVGQWWGIRLLVVLSGLAWLWVSLMTRNGISVSGRRLDSTLLRVFLVFLFLRFAVPLALIANETLFDLFLQSKYLESTEVIESAGSDIESAVSSGEESNAQEPQSIMGRLERALESTGEALNLSRRVEYIKNRAADVIEHLIQLSVVFIFQSAILPLAFLWALVHVLKRLIRLDMK
ncbi:MAG TPA: hypothetical protein VKN35_06530 [Xanthomonadales bacterium]|nr:hypothetical protein [Xanthomonadales bacterium]